MSKFGGRWVRPGGFEHDMFVPDGADYDPEIPDHFTDFCEEFLRFPHGHRAGKPVVWSSWQRDLIIRPTWGLVWPNGRRVTRERFFLSARGTAKSSLAAAEAVWAPNGLGLPLVDVDLYAVSIPQASIVFGVVEGLIDASPQLDQVYNISRQVKKAVYQLDGVRGTIIVRSGDAKAELGRNPDISYLDELLAQKNRQLFDAVRTSAGKKPDSLFAMMTTPDLTVQSFAREEYQWAKTIMSDRGAKEHTHYLPIIFEADEDDDPFDRQTWLKAAPNLGDFLDEAVYEQEAARARDNPVALHSFKVYRLALWADAGTGFINMEQWKECAGELPVRSYLAELPSFFGLDMSTANDLTSLAIIWWDAEAETAWVAWKHWSTERMFAEMDEVSQGKWKVWAKSPAVDLTIVPGGWIPGEVVAEAIMKLAAEFNPVWIGYDTYRSQEMNQYLGEDGADLPVQLLHGGGKQMMAATERVQGWVAAGRLRHNGDPVAGWCAQNSEVRIDGQGYPLLLKQDGDKRLRIDAVAALRMAVDRVLAWERDGMPDPISRIWFGDDDLDDAEGGLDVSDLLIPR